MGIPSVNECDDDEKTQINGKLGHGDKTKLNLLIEDLARLSTKCASLGLKTQDHPVKTPDSAFACQVLTSFLFLFCVRAVRFILVYYIFK